MAKPAKIYENGVSMQQTGFSKEQSEALVRMIQNVVENVVTESLQPVIRRLDALEANTDARFQAMEARMDARFKEIEARFREIEARFREIEARLTEVNARIDSIQARLNMFAWVTPGLLLLVFFGFSGIILTLVAILMKL